MHNMKWKCRFYSAPEACSYWRKSTGYPKIEGDMCGLLFFTKDENMRSIPMATGKATLQEK